MTVLNEVTLDDIILPNIREGLELLFDAVGYGTAKITYDLIDGRQLTLILSERDS